VYLLVRPRGLCRFERGGQGGPSAGEGGERSWLGCFHRCQYGWHACRGVRSAEPEYRQAQHGLLAQVPIPPPLLGEGGPGILHQAG
jgi:hypothetical protein